MIIQSLMHLLYSVLDNLLILNIPSLPTSALEYITTLFDYLVVGAGLLNNYLPLGYFLVLFGVLLAVDAGIMIYHFVMWILRKIPVASIS